MRGVIVVTLILLLSSGCSTKKTLKNIQKTKLSQPQHKPLYKPKSKNWITISLYKEYKKWYKTPYRYGGCSRDGIDCSSLVQRIYKEAFNIKIPRTTKEQMKIGYKVSKSSIKAGDLVFFKTGYKTRHTGIIIEGDKFIHTSTKRGVMISQLHNPYWKQRYWQSRRVLP